MAERIWVGEQLFNVKDELRMLDTEIQNFRGKLLLPTKPDLEAAIKIALRGLYERYTEAYFKQGELVKLIQLKK